MARILVVDDHPSNCRLVATILGYAEHKVLEARDGADALDLLAESQVDLVISDILMPTMDGVAFVNALRADPRLRATRVIFHTATYRHDEALLLAECCGVARVLHKPCQPMDLLAAVHDELGLPRFEAPAEGAWDSRRMELGQPPPAALEGLWTAGPGVPAEEALAHMQKVNLRLTALLQASLEQTTEPDPNALLRAFSGTARDLVSARFAMMGILDEEGAGIRQLITHGMPPGPLGSLPPRTGFLQRLLQDGRPIRVQARGEGPDTWGLPQGTPAFGSLLAMPVATQRATFGWICFMDHLAREGFSEEDEVIAAAVTAQMALAYENSRLHESLRAEIQSRVQAEGAQASLLEILNTSQDAVITFDLDRRITRWNKGAEKLFGYRAEEMLGEPYFTLIPAEQRALFRNLVQAILDGARPPVYEAVRLRKDGVPVQVMVHPAPVRDARGRLTGINVILRDLSDHRRLEASLHETSTQLRNVFNTIDQVIWSYDTREGRLVAVSPASSKVFGHPPEAFFVDGNLWWSLIHPEDLPESKRCFESLVGGSPTEWDYRVIHPGAVVRWVRSRVAPARDASGAVVRIDGTSTDVTEHHRAEAALRRSEAQFRSLVQSMDDIVFTLDDAGRLTGIYGRGLEALGSAPTGWLGCSLQELLPPEQARVWTSRCHEVLEEGARHFDPEPAFGRRYRISAAPILEVPLASQGIVGVAHDLTDFLDLHERLFQQGRLAALGTLVGSVAHDVRNPLGNILNSLELVEADGERSPSLQKHLVNMRKAANRISALMNELLDYANPRSLDLQPCRIDALVEAIAQDCQGLAAQRKVRLVIQLEDVPEAIRLDSSRTHQVLKNLVENAIQHSPAGGEVSIRGQSLAGEDGLWVLTVEDQGPGIAPEDLPRLFDPFFSRRAGGTGLGLAISLRIAEQHGWHLSAANRTGGGALFSIRFR